MAPKEQLRSLAHPLDFLMDTLRLVVELELPQVTLHLLGKLMGAQCAGVGLSGGPQTALVRSCLGRGAGQSRGSRLWHMLVKMELHCRGGRSVWAMGSLPAARERLADAAGSAAHMAQTTLLTL